MTNLIADYKSKFQTFQDFKIKIEILVIELLNQNKLKYHKLESRVKETTSLEAKVQKKESKYKSINEVTDLIGLRIITYFEDEVDKIADLLSKEFNLDTINSIDKRKSELDKFGYKSLHYVLSLKETRKKLTEYKRFGTIKFEVQIRSVLQHAWAEIEHDIGYKGELDIPDIFKRDFSRISALLETADIEFVRIKRELNLYEKNVKNEIEKNPEDVELNSISLKSYILNNKYVKYLDSNICKRSGFKIDNNTLSNLTTLERLYFLEIKSIKELDTKLEKYGELIISFAEEWLRDTNDKNFKFNHGISIFYLCYLIVAEKNDVEYANIYFNNILMKNLSNKEGLNKGQRIIEVFKKINVG